MIERHRAVDVVPQRGRVRPVAADGLDRLRRGERSLTADERVLWSLFSGWSVTGFTTAGEDVPSFGRGSAPARAAGPVRRHVDVDQLQLFGLRCVADGRSG